MQRVEIRRRPMPRPGVVINLSSLDEIVREFEFEGYEVQYDKDREVTGLTILTDNRGGRIVVREGQIISKNPEGLDLFEIFDREREASSYTFKSVMG